MRNKDLKKIKRGSFIKRSFLGNSKKWLVVGIQRPLIHTDGKTEILIQSKRGNIKRITIEAVKVII